MDVRSSFEQGYYENDSLWSGPISSKDLDRIEKVISIIPDDVKSVLDVGCGNGILINLLTKNNHRFTRIHGIDRSKAALRYVKTEKSVGDINQLPFQDTEFDLVTCLEVLEHLPKQTFDSAIKEIARVSSKYIIITVPYHEDLSKNQTQCPECKSKFHISLHLRSFSAISLKNLFVSQGFTHGLYLKIGESKHFYLITPMKRLLARILKKKKREPRHRIICPVCGLIINNEQPDIKTVLTFTKSSNKFKLQSYWPATSNFNWHACLFEKTKTD